MAAMQPPLEPEPEPELRVAEGAALEAARMAESDLTATKIKRAEHEPWHADELAMRTVLLGRLQRREGWSTADSAALDSTLMLQTIRGYHHEAERVEKTSEKYFNMLDWRRDIGAAAPGESAAASGL